MNFGAFAEITPSKQGLIHISEISTERVEDVESVLKSGDIAKVKVIKVDKQGRIDLSIKALLSEKSNISNDKNDKSETEDDEARSAKRKGSRKQVGGN